MLTPRLVEDRTLWNTTLHKLPHAHILQTWEWGEFKRVTTGWQPHRLLFERDGQVVAMVSVGVRRVGPFVMLYAPKGPIFAYEDTTLAAQVLAHLEKMARRMGAVWLKIDPDVIAATGIPSEGDNVQNSIGQSFTALLAARNWRPSADQIQFRNTITLDLSQSEDDLLAAMGQSTRRKIRIAQRDSVTVRSATIADLPLLYSLYQETGSRDGFLIRPPAYYEAAWRTFMAEGLAHALIAEFEGTPLAHVILFHFGRTCWYFYGASRDHLRDKMPTYLLQLEAIRWAKAQGYTTYDFWGAPDTFTETDSMWGVYQFKRGFHGTVTRHIGAWDYAPYPPLYSAYTQVYPRLLALMRRRAASSTL